MSLLQNVFDSCVRRGKRGMDLISEVEVELCLLVENNPNNNEAKDALLQWRYEVETFASLKEKAKIEIPIPVFKRRTIKNVKIRQKR